MKAILAGAFLLFATFSFAAVSLDQIIKLSELKTSDQVILQLIQKEGLAKPVTSKDIIYLKEHGVSDGVVQHLMKVSKQNPAEEAGSKQVSDSIRSYYTTGKDGKKVQVLTNIDKNGKRMGGEVIPEPEPPPQPQKPPQEVRVIVENQQQPSEHYPSPDHYEEEYVDEKYLPPSYFPPSYTDFYAPYSPYYYYPYQHNRVHPPLDPNKPHWRYDQGLDKPRPQPQPREGKTIPGPKGQSVKKVRPR